MRALRPLLALAALTVAGTTLAPQAKADEAEALACVRARTWEQYEAGWQIRTQRGYTLPASAARRQVRLNLYPGNTYLFQACGDAAAGRVTLGLFREGAEPDAAGKVSPVAFDAPAGREPTFEFSPEGAGIYILLLQADDLSGDEAGLALSVSAR